MKRILCFGDSNTWGYNPEIKIETRLEDKFRWANLLQKKLGKDYVVIEDGMNGRTINTNYPLPEHWFGNGRNYLLPCSKAHKPLALLVVMLGTNDLKNSLNNNVEKIAKDLEFVISEIKKDEDMVLNKTKILIICPPRLRKTVMQEWQHEFEGASEKSAKLENLFRDVAKKTNCEFLSALNLSVGSDGLHMSKESHENLANIVHEKIVKLF